MYLYSSERLKTRSVSGADPKSASCSYSPCSSLQLSSAGPTGAGLFHQTSGSLTFITGSITTFHSGNTVSCQQPKSIDSFKDSNIGAIGLGFYYNFVESFFSLGAEVNYASHWGQSDSYAGEFAIAAVARHNAYKQFDKLSGYFFNW